MKLLVALLCLAGSLARASEVSDIYDKKCSVCHGDDGKGQTRMGKRFHAPSFTSAKWQAAAEDAKLRQVIEDGVVKDGVHVMPGWKGKLTSAQVDALIRLVRGFGKH